MKRLLVVTCALLAAATSAYAQNTKTYSILLTGLCDHYTLTESAGAIVGQSDATNCDDANMAGTLAKVKVTPDAKVLDVATDLGGAPVIYQLLFDMKTKMVTIYYTPDGVTGYSASTPFTLVKDGAAVTNSGLPRLRDTLRRQ
ncbi:MAG TPA: hypothetical protein VGK90_03405 [Rhizomicrobium sp.]